MKVEVLRLSEQNEGATVRILFTNGAAVEVAVTAREVTISQYDSDGVLAHGECEIRVK